MRKTRLRELRRKAQQEIVGFVLIVVIIVIIGVIFLGINLRKDKGSVNSVEDTEISNFLYSSLKYTTNCIIKQPNLAELEDAVKECYNDRESFCAPEQTGLEEVGSEKIETSQLKVCEVVNQSYFNMLEKLWPAGADRPIKYSKISAYYRQTNEGVTTEEPAFLEIEQGAVEKCSSKRAGSYSIYDYPGSIIVKLEICD